jgi:hypothetical protein
MQWHHACRRRSLTPVCRTHSQKLLSPGGTYARNCVPPRLRPLPASSSTLLSPTSLIFGFWVEIARWFQHRFGSTLVPTAVVGREKSPPVVDGSTGETTKPTAAGSLNEPLVPTLVPAAGGTVLVAPTSCKRIVECYSPSLSAGGTFLDESPTISPTRNSKRYSRDSNPRPMRQRFLMQNF